VCGMGEKGLHESHHQCTCLLLPTHPPTHTDLHAVPNDLSGHAHVHHHHERPGLEGDVELQALPHGGGEDQRHQHLLVKERVGVCVGEGVGGGGGLVSAPFGERTR
jgi:hypothetical protein